MSDWRLVEAGVTLRDQVNRRFPKRDKASDGWIGDQAHRARRSDHNPDKDGWVHAIDIDADLGAKGDAERLADQLLELARNRKDGGRLKNIVFRNRVASGTYPETFWEWRHDATLGHQSHIHVSFTDRAEDDGSPFACPILKPMNVERLPSRNNPPTSSSAVNAATAPAKKAPAKKPAK